MRISDWSSDVCSSDLPGLVAAEIVHDDDIARLEAGDQLLANIGQEAFAVDRTVEDARRGEPIAAQGGQEGNGAPEIGRAAGRKEGDRTRRYRWAPYH